MHRTEHIEPGYRAYNGATICEAHAKAYNRLSDEIAGLQNSGLPVPETLLNQRHKVFSMAIAT